jgi:hypothetical protein
MPTKTKMLDYGGFVHSPEAATSAEFAAYLRRIDPLLAAWRDADDRWSQSRFSPELLERRKNAKREFDAVAATYQDQYTIKHVEQNPAFLPVSRFFTMVRPIRKPFSILHCNMDLPLHTVYMFENDEDLSCVNAALGKAAPMRWWQNGPSDHPCYLFGQWIWELKPTELNSSDKGLTLLFETTTEKDLLQRNRLPHDLSGASGTLGEQYIPEAVRTSVWRRDGGKCIRCGSREGVDFSVVVAAAHGNTATAQNVQMLCARCRGK